ncbi:hypothetical protein ABPG74_002868 [Tetrahymena malaccensis]
MSIDMRQSIQQDKQKMKDVSKRHQMWLGGFLTETNWISTEKNNLMESPNKTVKSEQKMGMNSALSPMATFHSNKFIPFIHERDSVGRLIREENPDQNNENELDQDSQSRKNSKHYSTENRLDKSNLFSQKNLHVASRTQSLNHLLFDTLIMPGSNGKKKQQVIMDDKRTYQRSNYLELNKTNEDTQQQPNKPRSINYQEFKIKTIQTNKLRETQSQFSPSKEGSTKPNSQHSNVRGAGGTVKQPRLGFNDQYHESKVPSIGYYNVSHNLIEPRVHGIFIKGKDKHFNKIPPSNFEGNPHLMNFRQTDKYVSTPDFQKSLARSQTNYKWAPEIYQDEINKLKESQKGFKLDNKQLESDYLFYKKQQQVQTSQQSQYTEEMPKTKFHQPPNKQEIKELTKNILKKFGFDIASKKFSFFREKYTLNL